MYQDVDVGDFFFSEFVCVVCRDAGRDSQKCSLWCLYTVNAVGHGVLRMSDRAMDSRTLTSENSCAPYTYMHASISLSLSVHIS